jgi:hypothetical protein
MRLAGRQRLGFYPLPSPEAERIRRFLQFPEHQCSTLDPCAGEGRRVGGDHPRSQGDPVWN